MLQCPVVKGAEPRIQMNVYLSKRDLYVMIVRTFGERFDTFWERRVDTLEHFIEDISVQVKP
jgi:hypothetical protein